jgi:hypothetical protein
MPVTVINHRVLESSIFGRVALVKLTGIAVACPQEFRTYIQSVSQQGSILYPEGGAVNDCKSQLLDVENNIL